MAGSTVRRRPRSPSSRVNAATCSSALSALDGVSVLAARFGSGEANKNDRQPGDRAASPGGRF